MGPGGVVGLAPATVIMVSVPNSIPCRVIIKGDTISFIDVI